MTFNPAWVVGNGKWESGLDISPPTGAKRKTLTPQGYSPWLSPPNLGYM